MVRFVFINICNNYGRRTRVESLDERSFRRLLIQLVSEIGQLKKGYRGGYKLLRQKRQFVGEEES